MRRLRFIIAATIALVATACTPPSISVDNPPMPNDEDLAIIDYIDKRLSEEYYWLDEVAEKSSSFNRRLQWEEYLDNSLLKLESNDDDGHIAKDGSRVFYSYIREVESLTRATTSGFGIALYYTIVILDNDRGYYGFVVDDVYAESPADIAGIKRGDVIMQIGGDYITRSNYLSRFTSIENNTASSLDLVLRRQVGGEEFTAKLAKGSYTESTVAHHEIIYIDDRKIGYLVYTGFEPAYDSELLDALGALSAGGAEEVILDLRTNGGGSVSSAIKLASSLLGPAYDSTTFCILKRNPLNTTTDEIVTLCPLQDTGISLGIDHLTVIASGYSASASEIIIEGLRGLDIPVTIVGTTTEGKNCGMDVTRRRIGSTYLEYAPITFMCFNAKDFGDWGEGIKPDVDLTTNNATGVKDEHFPLPRTEWGDTAHDIGLAAAIATITGKSITTEATRTATASCDLHPSIAIDRPVAGTRLER